MPGPSIAQRTPRRGSFGRAFHGARACGASVLPVADLADLSLEELGNLRVTSVALREERLLDAPASIFVITAEDIRHSAAKSLPEALRLAPNLEVAQVSATTWAISARGFQNVVTNKLLVLVEARSTWRVNENTDLAVSWRYVSSLSYLATVPAYHTGDVRIAWRPRPNLELSVTGANLLGGGHVEFNEHGFAAVIPRSAYAHLRWAF